VQNERTNEDGSENEDDREDNYECSATWVMIRIQMNQMNEMRSEIEMESVCQTPVSAR